MSNIVGRHGSYCYRYIQKREQSVARLSVCAGYLRPQAPDMLFNSIDRERIGDPTFGDGKLAMATQEPIIDTSLASRLTGKLITVLIPVYNEEETVNLCHQEVTAVINAIGCDAEILYVNDGSDDSTWELLTNIQANDSRTSLINLSRNFGKEIAMSAGLEHSMGDAVIILDADLQDPPRLIRELLEHWLDGYDNVYGKRMHRDGESWVKKYSASKFYSILRLLSRVSVPENTGDFRLLSRRAVEAVNSLPEQHRFMKGLFSWVGFKQKELLYDRAARVAGTTKYSYWKLWNFALEGITSFSAAPLKLATYIGFMVSLVATGYGTYIVVNTLIYGNPVAGFPSIMTVILFIGGIQLMFTGIIGEYLGRTFDEVKRRPLYFVDEYLPAKAQAQKRADSANRFTTNARAAAGRSGS